MRINQIKLAVIGVGYVGLPIAIKFGQVFDTVGFDVDILKIQNLKIRKDLNNEFKEKDFLKSKKLTFSNKLADLKDRNVFIVCIPTPINKKKEPHLDLIYSSIEIISKALKPKDLIIFESTFYPGLTEEVLIPLIEKKSKIKNARTEIKTNKKFYIGYSPERINPGDKNHNIENINKIISSNNKHALGLMKKIYSKIINAKLVEVSSIKVAEAAKVIENTQRDINIALINEFSQIFKKLNIDTEEVLKAAETKWNFLKFKPGFVGGHCIGVDPYYLSHRSIQAGYKPKILLTGRKINDQMPFTVFNEIVELAKIKKINLNKSNILFMGATFKENVSDTRNSKVFDLIDLFKKYNSNIYIYDPHIKSLDSNKLHLTKKLKHNYYDLIIYAVNHKIFNKFLKSKIRTFSKINSIIYDLKYALDKNIVDLRL